MAGKIRGISIELSADTSGIVSGLKGADTSIRKTQQELKDINRLLKLDPNNMTLLKQRTQALQTQIGNTSTKLQELKNLEQEMKSEGVDKNSEQFKALQREIIATEQELKKLESTAGSGSATMLKISQTATKFGEGLETAGKKLMPVTAGITALGVASVKSFKEVDAGADTVIKKTGATGEAAEELKGIYEEVASTVSGSFEDAGKAVGEINTRFGVTGTELTTLSQDFMKFSKITDQDVESAVIGVDKAMKTFGVSTEDTDGVLGLLAKTSQDTGISVETLEGLLQNSGDQLKEMGLGLEESVQLMGNFEKNGLDSNKMLARLAKAAAYYSKEGKSMSEGLGDLVKGLQDSSTEADATAEAYKIFGKRAGLAFITAAKEGKLSFSGLSSDLSSYKSTVNDTYEGIIDETDKLEITWKNTKIALADAGKTILSAVAPAIQKLATFVKDLVAKWKGLDDGTKKTIIKFAGIAAAVAPALIVFGKVSKAIGAITKVMSTLKFTKFLTNPATLAIAAVAGLVAGLVALSKKIRNSNAKLQSFDEEISKITESNSKLKSEIDETEQALDDNLKTTEGNAAAAKALWQELDTLTEKEDKTATDKEKIKVIVDKLNEIVPNLGLAYDEVADSLNRTNEEIKTNIELANQQAKVTALTDAYSESIKQAAEAQMELDEAQENVNKMLAEAPDDLRPALEFFQEFGETATMKSNAYSAAYLKYADDFDRFKKATQGVTDAQENLARAEKNTIKWQEQMNDSITDLADAQAEATKAINAADFSDFKQELENTLGKDVADRMNDAINSAEKAGVQIPQELKDGVLNGKTSVKSAIQQINALTRSTLAENKSKIKAEGRTHTLSYAGALEEKKSAAKSSAKKVADSANEGLATGEKKAKKTGKETVGGYSTAISDGSTKSEKAGKKNASSANTGLETGIDPAGTSGTNTSDTYNTGLNSYLDTLGKTGADLAKKVTDNLGFDATTEGENSAATFVQGIKNQIDEAGKAAAEIVKKIMGVFGGTSSSSTSSLSSMLNTTQSAFTNPNYAIPTTANTFIQNNYSPKSLTASDIYRQTHNLLNVKG